MGYYTKFELETDAAADLELNIFEWLAKQDITKEYMEYAKWYEHEKDMKAASKKFPDVMLTLSGYGEEAEDIWRKYFKGGKVHRSRARIVFDKFDERLLDT